jgi:hypothetical protein
MLTSAADEKMLFVMIAYCDAYDDKQVYIEFGCLYMKPKSGG